MATFNPEVRETGVPDFTGASRGVPADRSFETLFSGLGNAIEGGAGLVDNSIKRNITDDVTMGYNKLNEPLDTLPPELASGGDSIRALQTAFDQGKISDTYYYGNLNQQLKSLRSKYPGYEAFIDDTMQSVTGVRPANAYRNALLSEIGKLQNEASDSEKQWSAWEKQNEQDIIRVFPDYFNNPGKYDRAVVRQQTVSLKGQEAGIQAENARVNYLANQNKLTEEQAAESATTALIQQANTFLSGQSNMLGFDSADFMSRISQGLNTGFDEQEYTSLVSQMNVAETTLRQNLLKLMNSPLEEGSSNSYASIIGIEETNKLVDQSMQQFLTIKQMITDQNFGMAGYYTRLNDLRQQRDTATVLDASPELRMVNALGEIDPALAEVWLREAGGQQTVFNALTPELLARMVSGQDDFNGIMDRIDTSKMTQEDKGALANTTISGALATITSGTATPEQVARAVQSIYAVDEDGRDVFNMVRPDEYSRLFTTMFNPQVTQALVATGDTASLQNYYEAARERLTAIPEFRKIAGRVQDQIDWQEGINVQFDPNTGRLSIAANQQDSRYNGGGVLNNNAFRSLVRNANEAVTELNDVFALISPMLDGLGVDRKLKGQVYQEIMKDLNVEVGGARKDDFFDWMGQQMQPAIDGMVEGVSNAATSMLQPTSDRLFNPQQDPNSPDFEGIRAQDIGIKMSINDSPFSFDFEKSIAENGAADPQFMVNAKSPLEAARGFLGYSEYDPTQAKAIAAFIKEATGDNINPATTAWCAAFLNAILKTQGQEGTGALNARSFLQWGTGVDTPQQGDIVVFERGGPNSWKGHVGLYVGTNEDGTIRVLGGNQGDSVSEKDFDASKVLGYRRANNIQ